MKICVKFSFCERGYLIIILIGIAMAAMAGCLLPNTIRIGVVAPMEGILLPYGTSVFNGVTLALQSNDTVAQRIEIFEEDDYCNRKRAANVAARLIEAKVTAVIGHLCSGPILDVLDTYLEAGIVVISPAASYPPLTKSSLFPNFFRTALPDDHFESLMISTATERFGWEQIALLYNDISSAAIFRDLLEASDTEIVLFDSWTPSDPLPIEELETQLTDTAAPNGIMLQGNIDTLIEFTAQLELESESEHSFNLIAGMNIPQPELSILDTITGFDNLYVAIGMPDQDEATAQIVRQVRELHFNLFNESGGAFLNASYAAMQFLIEAIAAVRTGRQQLSYETLRDALHTVTPDTPIGQIQFNEVGDILGAGAKIYRLVEGELTPIDPQ